MAQQTSLVAPAFAAIFAKNWLFQLTQRPLSDQATSVQGAEQQASPTPLKKSASSKQAIRWSLRWLGGGLLWLLLVLPAQAAVELRVAVSQGKDVISVGSSTTGIISNGNGQPLYQLPELQGITIKADGNEVDLTNGNQTLSESSAFWLEPSEDGFVWIGDRWYRGRVMVTLEAGKLTAINYVDLDDYLYSVVASEMPSSWPQAALQSQAVAARSYALYKRSRNRNPLYDVDATTNYQVYKGLAQEQPSTIAAVQSTLNQVVTHNGEVIEAIFHSSSGGFTENASEVWSSDVPYLRGVEDYDQSAPVFSWEKNIYLERIQRQNWRYWENSQHWYA